MTQREERKYMYIEVIIAIVVCIFALFYHLLPLLSINKLLFMTIATATAKKNVTIFLLFQTFNKKEKKNNEMLFYLNIKIFYQDLPENIFFLSFSFCL